MGPGMFFFYKRRPIRAQKDPFWPGTTTSGACNDFRSAKRNIYWASLTTTTRRALKSCPMETQHVPANGGTRSISVHALELLWGFRPPATPEWDDTMELAK